VTSSDYWDAEAAAEYDENSADMFEPDVLDPAVDVLAELAGAGAALEFAIGTGRVALPSSLRSAQLARETPSEFDDRRVGATFVLYPQPFGLQAEWNVGRGPEADPEARTVRERSLDGGYVLASYRARAGKAMLIPFVQAHRYDGGKKYELDARRYRVRELAAGFEWTVMESVELTAQYQLSDRRYEDLANPDNRQEGRLLRLQGQFSF